MTRSSLVEIVLWLEDVFDRIGLERSYGGAIAYNYYGPPRLTLDVDVLVLLPAARIPALLDELGRGGCLRDTVPPRPIELSEVLADLRDKARLTAFRCRGVRVEVFTPWHPFHHRVLARSLEREIDGRRIRVHRAEDLIVFKKVFDRPKDLMDIRAMLLAGRGKLELELLRKEAALLLPATAVDELEAMIQESETFDGPGPGRP